MNVYKVNGTTEFFVEGNTICSAVIVQGNGSLSPFDFAYFIPSYGRYTKSNLLELLVLTGISERRVRQELELVRGGPERS